MKKLTVEQWLACVGPGWHSIVRPLVEYAQAHDLNIVQVKEKFGGLRFYSAVDATLSAMVEVAEAQSVKTCEECGNPGKPRGGGWIKTLCDEHAKGHAEFFKKGFQPKE